MMKAKNAKSSTKNLRHNPMKFNKYRGDRGKKVQHEGDSDEEVDIGDMEEMPDNVRRSVRFEDDEHQSSRQGGPSADSDEEVDKDEAVDPNLYYDGNQYEEADGDEELEDMGMYDEETARQFLSANKQQSLSLADIILAKLREKESQQGQTTVETGDEEASVNSSGGNNKIPPKVVEVYTAVGNLLQHYRSGKIPKALKMLPNLKGWERILWLTRPDLWSPAGTFAVTRIFASNLQIKLVQRFYNLVLLEKCRDDIQLNSKLNYHLYMALKKSLFKPAAFFKGILLPLASSGTCTLREALIIGSVLVKVSIPAIHSAAALLRLTEFPYSGAISVFIKIMLQKKYAFPMRVISALCDHFQKFIQETRALPVIWHVSLLVFVQRYKFEFSEQQVEDIHALLRVKGHVEIGAEIRRELATRRNNTLKTMMEA